MAIGVPQSIGFVDSGTSGAGEDVTITVGAGGVPVDAIIFLLIHGSSNSSVIDGISDSKGNTYTSRYAIGHTGGSSVTARIATGVCTTPLVSGDTITISFNQFASVRARAYYVEGLDTVSGYVGSNGNEINFSTNFTSPALATTVADTIFFGFNVTNEDAQTFTPGGSFTELEDEQSVQPSGWRQTQYLIVSAASSQQSIATMNAAGDGCAVITAFAAIPVPPGISRLHGLPRKVNKASPFLYLPDASLSFISPDNTRFPKPQLRPRFGRR